MRYKIYSVICIVLMSVTQMAADNGSHLWLRLPAHAGAQVIVPHHSPTMDIAADELKEAWRGVPVQFILKKEKRQAPEGFSIRFHEKQVTLTSSTEIGLLYAAYHLLRLQETGQLTDDSRCNATNSPISTADCQITETPAYSLRILNHWDNLNRTVERGYAGQSLWNWNELPDTLSPRYKEYARLNASLGINGTVLNNVNASPQILSSVYLEKVKALADVFRPYGLRVYLSVNFASPMVLGGLPTADPLDRNVIRWWKEKAKEIYRLIPDFGGFLVKANSEGQPGPCDYGRTHAEGANMLANALKPYQGIVMWRAFVYSPSDADRAKQAYLEFKPLDGQFRSNVIVQVKNGPVDFQPREPYSPLFTAMPRTPLMAEFQITQEYLGHSNHLAYLAPMWKEFFSFVPPASLKAIAGVANTGTDANWCGHTFAQANWYAFGRLAWNPHLSSEEIADEWLRQSICQSKMEKEEESSLKRMMLESREAVVNYMMPLGLHHLFAWGHHYGPEPWCDIPGARPDWMPSYYHKAGKDGIGFNRSHTGSNATGQYPDALRSLYDHVSTCPEEYLLWFHHLPWTYRMKSGRTLWEELCLHYDCGVRQVREFQKIWDNARESIIPGLFEDVRSSLKIQLRDAVWWKDACLLYFQGFSNLPFPADMERPIHELEELKQVKLPISNFECPTKEMLDTYR